MSSALLQSAETYLDRGLSVIPMVDKRPALRWKRYQDARPTDRHLKRWFHPKKKRQPTGVAIIFGRVSGNLAQRDFDTLDSYRSWSDEQPALAAILPTAATRSGFHVYFQSDPEDLADLRKRIGSTGHGAIKVEFGELRADVGCYSVAPASRHPSGFIYEWLKPLPDKVPVAPLAAFYAPEFDVSPDCCTCNALALILPALSVDEDGVSERIKASISATIPTRPGERNRKIFDLARHLRSVPGLAHSDPVALESVVREWWAKAKPFTSGQHSFTDTLTDFIVAWKRAKVAIGTTAIGPIFERAITADVPKCAGQFADEPKLQVLIALLRELQRSSGESPFFLSCDKAAELLSTFSMTVWCWLELLKAKGIVEIVAKGRKGKRQPASEYRYRGE